MSLNMAWVGRATWKAGTYFRWDFYLGVEVDDGPFLGGGGGNSIIMGTVHQVGGGTSTAIIMGESSLVWGGGGGEASPALLPLD